MKPWGLCAEGICVKDSCDGLWWNPGELNRGDDGEWSMRGVVAEFIGDSGGDPSCSSLRVMGCGRWRGRKEVG